MQKPIDELQKPAEAITTANKKQIAYAQLRNESPLKNASLTWPNQTTAKPIELTQVAEQAWKTCRNQWDAVRIM